MPKISVVMPTRSQGKFIGEAIQSILDQTFRDFELIVVNNMSDDNTVEVVLPLLRDSRVRLIDAREHGSTGYSLNKGFLLASGEYETWFASDNRLYPNAFETLSRYLDENPGIDHVHGTCDYAMVDGSGHRITSQRPLGTIINQQWEEGKLFKGYFLGICWLWRKSIRLKAGPYFIHERCEDYDMALRMYEAGGKFSFLNENLGWYRQHSANLSSDPATQQAYLNVLQRKVQKRNEP